jgi:ABC-type phosphate transport system substrate-binding protein
LRSLVGWSLSVAWFQRAESARARDEEFRVIVHPRNPLSSASREFIADVFLKKASRWEDGEVIRPADLRPNSNVRRSFSESVLRRSVAAVRNYWQQRIFSGRDVPPPELESEEAVVQYVLTHSGAVGYVSAAARLGAAKAIVLK